MGNKNKYWQTRRDVGRFCKQSRRLRLSRYKVNGAFFGRITRWQDTILTIIQELAWQHKKDSLDLCGATVKQWKEGWLFIWEVRTSTGKPMKLFAYGPTLTECLRALWLKCSQNNFQWKINEK